MQTFDFIMIGAGIGGLIASTAWYRLNKDTLKHWDHTLKLWKQDIDFLNQLTQLSFDMVEEFEARGICKLHREQYRRLLEERKKVLGETENVVGGG